MSNTNTIARPYAKAIFQYALDTKQLSAWSNLLHYLASIMLESETSRFINNPSTTPEMHSQLFLDLIEASNHVQPRKAIENLIHLLAENKRLPALADIYAQFEAMRAEEEKTIVVDVSSFSVLNNTQRDRLIASLSQRMQRRVNLKETLDKSLLGGAVIRAGDFVIDGSVRGKLNKLASVLVA